MQMQLVKHVTFSHAFIITYSMMEKVGNLMKIAQVQAGMQVWLPLVEREDCLPHQPEAPIACKRSFWNSWQEPAQMQPRPNPAFRGCLPHSTGKLQARFSGRGRHLYRT